MIEIKGLDIPIHGSPTEDIIDSKNSRSVALLGVTIRDEAYNARQEGYCEVGQPLFEDKRIRVLFTSPAGGKVEQLIEVREEYYSLLLEIGREEEAIEFNKYSYEELDSVSPEEIRAQLSPPVCGPHLELDSVKYLLLTQSLLIFVSIPYKSFKSESRNNN